MATERILRTYSLEQTLAILRSRGMSIGRDTLSTGLQQGKFPFGDFIGMSQGVYIIYEALLERWIAERCVEEEIPIIPA